MSCTDNWYTLDRRGINKDELHRQLVYTSPEGGQQGWVAQTAGIHLTRGGLTRMSCTDRWYTLDQRGFNKDELHRQLVYTSPEGCQQGWVAQTGGIHLTEGGLTRMSCTDSWYTLDWRGINKDELHRQLVYTSPEGVNKDELHRQLVYTWPEGV